MNYRGNLMAFEHGGIRTMESLGRDLARVLLTSLVISLLGACGGGGGGSSSSDSSTPELASNADLLDLVLRDVPLDQTFQAEQLAYTASAKPHVSSTSVIATVADANATVSVNGLDARSGYPSDKVALPEGITTIAVEVTAEDTVAKTTYHIEVNRAPVGALEQEAYIKAPGAKEGEALGSSMALSGNTLAVVASGANEVHLFSRNNGVWSHEDTLNGPIPGCFPSCAGSGVALWDDTLAVGSPGDSDSAGAVYIYSRANGVWSDEQVLRATFGEGSAFEGPQPHFGDGFGSSVAIFGDVLAIGAPGESSSATGGEKDNSEIGSGAVYIFVRESGRWIQKAFLKAADAKGNKNIGMGFVSGDNFGSAIALTEGSLAVGAGGKYGVYVFEEINESWSQEAYLESAGTVVSMSSDTLAVGGSNRVKLYQRDAGAWMEQETIEAPNGGYTRYPDDFSCGDFVPPARFGLDFSDDFGRSVALLGDALFVGAPGESSSARGGESDNSSLQAGAVYVFMRNNGDWTQAAFLKASNAEGACTWSGAGLPTYGGDEFGTSVVASEDTIVVGAPREDSNAGSGESDNSEDAAGAAYVFRW
jgi:hypothetical protein